MSREEQFKNFTKEYLASYASELLSLQETDIIQLEKEITSLKAELAQQRFNNENNLSIDQKVSDELTRLKEENEMMRVGLEFYKKESTPNHAYDLISDGIVTSKRAREILSKIDENKKEAK